MGTCLKDLAWALMFWGAVHASHAGDSAGLDVGGAARRLQQVPARHSYQCPGGSCVPSLAALPQQTDADLLRPLMLANDRPYAVAGLDQALHELEQAMLGASPDPAALAHSRAPTILAFRERVDYRIRLAASPALRTVCDLNFMCGQAALVALEANPLLRVLAFGVGGDLNTQRCRKFLEQRYPGRIVITEGPTAQALADFTRQHMISTVYTGPVCDLMLLDGAQDYRVRRQELLAAQPMLDCGTLIEHGDACQPELCLSYNATDCLSEHGKCQPLDAASFEGATMLLHELQRQGMVQVIDTFYLPGPQFHHSWALSRVQCDKGKPKRLPQRPLFSDGAAARFAAKLDECFTARGCLQPVDIAWY